MLAPDHDVIVVGTGIAGLTAAKHSVRNGFSVATVESMLFGGLVINVNQLDGTIEGSGADLASTLMMETSDAGAASLSETVLSIESEGDALIVTTDAGPQRARAVIVASGAKLKRLGVPGEAEFEARGVSQCADCDGPMCKGEDVVVVGGGDSALQEALVLAEFCRTVHLVHRRGEFRARAHLVSSIGRHDNVKIWWNTEVTAILGASTVDRVRVRNGRDGASSEIPCVGVFAYIGLAPSSEFAPPAIERDAQGALVTDASMQTALPGVYAIGAVRAGYKGMLDDAVGEAMVAADAVLARLRA